MLLWVLLAVVTGIAVLGVLVPLGRADREVRSRNESDLAVYRDQLREIDGDLERSVISPEEAEAARTEVARRLLAARNQHQSAASVAPKPSGRIAMWGAIAGIPLISLSLYLALGSPGLPGQPLAARMAAPVEDQDVATLIARVEKHLAENPQDGRGWEVLAPVYMRMGRYEDAVRAWRSAIRYLGSTPERQASLGEALIVMEDGLVTDEARAAMEAALEASPEAVTPRFFLAVAAEQDGEWAIAAERWRALVADAPPDAPWRVPAEERLAAAEENLGNQSGPSSDEIAAASQMSEEERAEMVSGMVAGLAARLKENGEDLDGWLRLARAYVVLGQTAKARDAIDSARRTFAGDRPATRAIDDAARELGLDS